MDKNKIFDAHIHFNDEDFYTKEELPLFIKEGEKNSVGGWLCASFDLSSSKKAVELSKQYKNIYAGIAIHPNVVRDFSLEVFDELDQLAKEEKVIAIGETGLDYFYTKEDINMQKDYFIRHIKLAQDNNKVLQVHIRDQKDVFDAYDDVLEITKKYDIKKKVVHCFLGNAQYAQKFLDEGWYINIGGAVTFKNAIELQEAATIIPLNRLLLETDAPYLTPHPHRGKRNEPKYIYLTAKKIAELKNILVKDLINQTTQNAFDLFNIK